MKTVKTLYSDFIIEVMCFWCVERVHYVNYFTFELIDLNFTLFQPNKVSELSNSYQLDMSNFHLQGCSFVFLSFINTSKLLTKLRKNLKDIKIISILFHFRQFFSRLVFESDKNINMQLNKIQNDIYGSLITIQYRVKYNNPL